MLSKVEARTNQGAMLSLPLSDASSGLEVRDIKGLDPVPAHLVSSSFARLDGEQFQSSRREKRNIVLTLGLEPDWGQTTVGQLRAQLYKFFMPKSDSTLRFYTDDFPIVDILGTVETFDCPLFVKDPEATISLICFDPDFYTPDVLQFAGNTTSGSTAQVITYDGTVDTGIVLTMNINRSMTGFTVYNQPAGDVAHTMQFTAALLAGDVVQISTVAGNKFATLTRGGVQSSLLYAISPVSEWSTFQPGNNSFWVNATGAAVPFTVQYTEKIGGL